MLIEELIERYKMSTNQDLGKDLNYMKKTIEGLENTSERVNAELQTIEIFLQKVKTNNLQLKTIIPIPKTEWVTLKTLTQELNDTLLGNAEIEEKERVLEKYNSIYSSSSFNLKVWLTHYKGVVDSKVAKQEAVKNKLLKNKQENASLQSTTPNYVVDAIRDLESKVGLSPLEYAIQYERIGGRLVQNLKDDLNIEDEQDRRRTFYKVFDVYKCKLQQIEMQADKEYDEMHPMYCKDVDFERQMTNDFLTTEDMEDTVRKWLEWLQYRMDVHRSSNNSFIDRMQQKILTWVTNKYN